MPDTVMCVCAAPAGVPMKNIPIPDHWGMLENVVLEHGKQTVRLTQGFGLHSPPPMMRGGAYTATTTTGGALLPPTPTAIITNDTEEDKEQVGHPFLTS